jgi:fluoride exporter
MSQALVICLGACAGALLRWQLGVSLNALFAIPLGTLAVNWIGGYLIGLCVGVFQAWPDLDAHWRLLWVTGFLGTLTTFSTFSAEVVGFMLNGRMGLALLSAGLHLLGSLTLTYLGIKTVEWLPIATSAS